MLYDNSIWINHLLTYLSLLPTDSKLQNLFTIVTLPNDLKFLILDYIILVLLLRPCLNQVIVENVIITVISTERMG